MRESLARDEERSAGVGVEDSVPLVEGEAFESGGGEDCSVVDEDVDAAEGGDDLSDGVADGRRRSEGRARRFRRRSARRRIESCGK